MAVARQSTFGRRNLEEKSRGRCSFRRCLVPSSCKRAAALPPLGSFHVCGSTARPESTRHAGCTEQTALATTATTATTTTSSPGLAYPNPNPNPNPLSSKHRTILACPACPVPIPVPSPVCPRLTSSPILPPPPLVPQLSLSADRRARSVSY